MTDTSSVFSVLRPKISLIIHVSCFKDPYSTMPGLQVLLSFHSQVGLNKSYDLVFSRMMTQHMVTPDVQKFLMSLSHSGSKYFLTTTFPYIAVNKDMNMVGSHRILQGTTTNRGSWGLMRGKIFFVF